MKSERSGSIHDLEHAPEAPASSALTLGDMSRTPSPRASPGGSGGNLRRTVSPPEMVGSILSALSLPFDDELKGESPPKRPRSRQSSAPGRIDDVEGAGADVILSDVSFGDPAVLAEYNEDDDDNDDDDDDNYLDRPHDLDLSSPSISRVRQRRLCGIFPLPDCFCSEGFNSRIASFLVRHAPCFWCCGNALEVGSTDRTILYRLNILCAIFASGQIVAGASLTFVLVSPLVAERDASVVDRDGTNNGITLDLWNLNGSIFLTGLVGCVVLVTSLLTLRVVREVNLRGSVRYLWTLLWLLPVQVFLAITLFDIFEVTEVWVRHWWYLPSMAWFRSITCDAGTSNTLCVVPIDGGQWYENEEAWCIEKFNATSCTDIRNRAQEETYSDMLIFYYTCAFWGVLCTLLLLLTTNILEQIITKPIVQTSRESNVPGWMCFPTIGSFTAGGVFLFSPSSALRASAESTNSQWVGVLYIFCGGFFFLSALLGWFIGTFSILNSRDKKNKNVAVVFFIGINVFIVLMLTAVFSGSVLVSTETVSLGMTDSERGRAACAIDTADSCSYCGNRVGVTECPEWTTDEVLKVLQTQFKASATLAVIFVMYAIAVLRYGIVLKKHISMYQIDYV